MSDNYDVVHSLDLRLHREDRDRDDWGGDWGGHYIEVDVRVMCNSDILNAGTFIYEQIKIVERYETRWTCRYKVPDYHISICPRLKKLFRSLDPDQLIRMFDECGDISKIDQEKFIEVRDIMYKALNIV